MTSKSLYCGIDIHSKKSFFCFLDETGETILITEVPTIQNEIIQLIDQYSDYVINYAFEAGEMTRFVSNVLCNMKNTNHIHIVHPLKFKLITESKHKNDKQDCKKLANALLKDNLPYPVHLKSEASRQIQTMLNLRFSKIKSRTSYIQQIKSIVRSAGLQPFTQKNYARPDNILNDFDKGILLDVHKEICALNDAIQQCEEKMDQIIQQHFSREAELLKSIPGIGLIVSSAVLAAIDTISRFEKAGQLSAYFGLVPSEHSSGNTISHGRITKDGPRYARSLLIQSAWFIIRNRATMDERSRTLRKKFLRITAKTKKPQKALVAIARHLARIIFGVLKNNEVFCEKVHCHRNMKLAA